MNRPTKGSRDKGTSWRPETVPGIEKGVRNTKGKYLLLREKLKRHGVTHWEKIKNRSRERQEKGEISPSRVNIF